MEAMVLADLFYRGLGWSPANAQAQLKGTIGSADIVLKPNLTERSRWVVIEVKAPAYDLKARGSVDLAVHQVTGYAAQWRGVSRCVVTNGRIWWFLSVLPRQQDRGPWYTLTLVRFDINRDRQLGRAILNRCTRARIGGLFDFLEERWRREKEADLLPGRDSEPIALPPQRWQNVILHSLENRDVYLRTILKPWRKIKTWVPA